MLPLALYSTMLMVTPFCWKPKNDPKNVRYNWFLLFTVLAIITPFSAIKSTVLASQQNDYLCNNDYASQEYI